MIQPRTREKGLLETERQAGLGRLWVVRGEWSSLSLALLPLLGRRARGPSGARRREDDERGAGDWVGGVRADTTRVDERVRGGTEIYWVGNGRDNQSAGAKLGSLMSLPG